MPLLTPLITHTPSAQPLFATVSAAGGASGGTQRAEAFIARNATPGVAGFVAACGDGSGATDAELFEMRTGGVVANTLQWTMGMSGTPAGTAGNDFVITAYEGAPLGTPFSIERATGNVAMSNNVAIIGDLVVGNGTDASGGFIEVNGTSGVSRVYDGVYNTPPSSAPEFLMATTTNVLVQTNVQNITPARSGLYVFTMEITASATDWAFANGTAIITGVLQSAGETVLDSYLVCDSLANPNGYASPGGTIPPNTYKKDIVAIVNLQAGIQYSANLNFNTAINLGTSGTTSGGVKFFIQQLLA